MSTDKRSIFIGDWAAGAGRVEVYVHNSSKADILDVLSGAGLTGAERRIVGAEVAISNGAELAAVFSSACTEDAKNLAAAIQTLGGDLKVEGPTLI